MSLLIGFSCIWPVGCRAGCFGNALVIGRRSLGRYVSVSGLMPRYGGIAEGDVLPCGAGIADSLPEKEFKGPVREAIVALSELKNAGGGDIGVILSAGDVCEAFMSSAGGAKGTGVCGSTGIPICCSIAVFCC